jgi:molybdenum cofactor guanylyltransferase
MRSSIPDPRPALAVGGVILAGGRSSRMGRPKAWLPAGESTMLQVVAAAITAGLRPVSPAGGAPAPLVVVGAPGQELPSLVPAPLRVDDEVEGEGPLRGMAAGLQALTGRVEAAFVSSCDVPLLRPSFVARMVALLGDADIAVPLVQGRHHPLAAVYRVGVLPEVRDLLRREMRRPFFLFERVRTRTVGPEDLAEADPGLDSLSNFNTPEEYAALAGAGGAAPRTGGAS